MQLDKDLQRMTYIDQQLTEWPFLVAEDGDVPEALKPRVHQMWDVVDQLHGLNVLGIDKGNRQVCLTGSSNSTKIFAHFKFLLPSFLSNQCLCFRQPKRWTS